jgi:N-acetylneuraminic acid mutarotase
VFNEVRYCISFKFFNFLLKGVLGMKKHRFLIISVLISVLILVGSFSLVRVGAGPLFAGGGVPTVVSYQGVVEEGGAPYTGTGYFKFAVVDASGTTSYWSNDGTSSGGSEPAEGVQLTVADGLFHVLLGDTNLTNMTALDASAFDGTECYLRVWFSSDGSTYTQLTPDRRIAAVPYALQAQQAVSSENADTLDGQQGSYYNQWGNLSGVPSDIADGDDDTQLPAGAMVLSDSDNDTTLINAGFSYTGLTVKVDSWYTKSDMPTGRRDLVVEEVGGILYAIGGHSSASFYESTNEAYDPVTDSWTTKSPMPTGRDNSTSAVVGDLIFVIGGHSSSNYYESANEVYDPATDTWETRAPMPTARFMLAAAAVDDVIYAVGGWSNATDWETANEAYDPAADSWSTKSSMPTGRNMLAASAIDGIIFYVGGKSSSNYESVNEVYDPKTDSWSTKAPMPTGRYGLASAVVDDVMYMMGGISSGPVIETANEAYDPDTDTWMTVTALPTARGYLSAATLENAIYVIGGASSVTNYHQENEMYVPYLYVYSK